MKATYSTLKNSLSLVTIDTQAFPTMTMIVLVGAGSRYESEKNNGIAHFFEHMAFKGSKKYPSAHDIASTIEGFGGVFNAFTSKDHTGYWVKSPNEHFTTVVDVLSDMILHPRLLPDEIDREKGVIIEEIHMYEDTPARDVSNRFDSLIFGGHPLGYDIAGTTQSVSQFSRQTFVDYLDEWYHPSNTTIVVAGGMGEQDKSSLDEEKIQTHIERAFGRWNGIVKKTPKKYVSTQTKPQISVRTKKTEQAHICVGYRAFPFADPRRYALSLLCTILGGGMSSRLFTEVRERRGLCYYISTGRDLYKDTGYMVTQAGVSTEVKKVNEAIKVIIAEHEKIASGELDEKELVRAKSLARGRLLLSLEDSHDVASLYGTRYLLHKDEIAIHSILDSIDRVTREDVLHVAGEIICSQGLNIAAIGPIEEDEIHLMTAR